MNFSILFSAFFLVICYFHSSFLFHDVMKISGNFEFAKVLFFEFFWSIFIIFYLIKWKIKTNVYLLTLLILIIISTILSPSPFISFFWWTSKWHGLIFFILLFFVSSILLSLENDTRNKIIKNILWWSIGLYIIALYELYFPSHDYGELKNRALGTFWHPSYIALFILMLLPFMYEKIFNQKKLPYSLILILSIICLLYTQQFFGIFLWIWFTLYFFYKKKYRFFYSILVPIVCISIFIFILSYYSFKWDSFMSRVYIWDTVLHILSTNIQTFIFWNGPETLSYFFSSSKVPLLYLYENIWYTADRAHNIFLDSWYSFWFFSMILYWICVWFLIKTFKKNPYYEACILFFIFNFLNFPSLTSYLLFLLCFTKILRDNNLYFEIKNMKILRLIIPLFLMIMYTSFHTYIGEIYAYTKDYSTAISYFPQPQYYYEIHEWETWKRLEGFQSEKYYEENIYTLKNPQKDCADFTFKYPAVENYFFCGEVLENIGKKESSKEFYKLGIAKLPDIWSKNSIYWKNYFVKNTITGHRFFSPKYSNMRHILETLDIPIEIPIK